MLKGSPRLQWEYLFPPIDVAIVSALIWLANRDPLSNIGLLYFFPLAEAAGTLKIRWSLAVAAMVLAGAAFATHGLRSEEPFNAAFRYFLIFVVGSLITLLARASASMREQLGVARDRKRIAMEIHDGVQGHLTTISKQLELTQLLVSSDADRAIELVVEGQETARLAADELRYLVSRMRAPALAQGFVPALRAFLDRIASRHGLAYTFEVEGADLEICVESEHAAFRIAQESLTNVVRHANARAVDIRLILTHETVELRINDDGTGFDSESKSDGLDGMRQRAESVRGRLSVTSRLGVGTSVEATLPRSSTHG